MSDEFNSNMSDGPGLLDVLLDASNYFLGKLDIQTALEIRYFEITNLKSHVS